MVFEKIQALQYVVFGLCYTISLGLVFRKKFGYLLFLLFSSIIVLYNSWILFSIFTGKVVIIAGIQVSLEQSVPTFVLSLFLLLFVFYFLQKEVAAPYFADAPRGWRAGYRESHPIPYSLYDETKNKLGSETTANISETGALLYLPKGIRLFVGDIVTVNLKIENEDRIPIPMEVVSEVMRIFKDQDKNEMAGVRFSWERNDPSSKSSLSIFLNRVFAPRFPANNSLVFKTKSLKSEGTLFDISTDGFFIKTEANVEDGEDVETVFRVFSLAHVRLHGTVKWKNPLGQYGKPQGFGVKTQKVKGILVFQLWILWKRFVHFQNR